MISIEGTELPYPNSFNWDESAVNGKQLGLTSGYSRYGNGSKHLVSLGWDNLSKTEYDLIKSFYNLQWTTFNTLTFLFEKAKMNRDIGPIEVFMNIESESRKGNNKYILNINLTQR